jgi:integrase
MPFQATVVYRRADRAWEKAGLGRLRLHQARHTYASFMIAAGINAKALSAFMGHSSIKVTFDLYGHLMPGTEAEAAALLDGFLARAHVEEEAAARHAEDPPSVL